MTKIWGKLKDHVVIGACVFCLFLGFCLGYFVYSSIPKGEFVIMGGADVEGNNGNTVALLPSPTLIVGNETIPVILETREIPTTIPKDTNATPLTPTPQNLETTTQTTNPVGPTRLIDINTAPNEELQDIPGVGPVIAGEIINYRNQNGLFSSVEDLIKISGIGEKTLEKMKPYIYCSAITTTTPTQPESYSYAT